MSECLFQEEPGTFGIVPFSHPGEGTQCKVRAVNLISLFHLSSVFASHDLPGDSCLLPGYDGNPLSAIHLYSQAFIKLDMSYIFALPYNFLLFQNVPVQDRILMVMLNG